MAKVTPTPVALSEAEQSSPASINPAVARCCEAWSRLFHSELTNGQHPVLAAHNAGKAYRNALPPLSGEENIGDFIACIAHGMLIGAIYGKEGTKLLYAAQVALSTVRRPSAPSKPAA